MTRRRPRIADLRAALWTVRALRAARRTLRAGHVQALPTAPPPLPAHAIRGVEAVLRRRPATCLEAALVRQRWLASHGVLCDVVIGVTSPREGFRAHAWLDAADAESDGHGQWRELSRVAA